MTELLVGTKKGLFALEGRRGGPWAVRARAFAGEPVEYAMRDPRTGRLIASVTSAFYGPKLDVQIKTALKKEETLSTAQLDFLLPQRFELEYIGEDGQKHRPVVIHRGIISTMERMTAFLLENFAGALPTWLSPIQAIVIPVSDKFADYAKDVQAKLQGSRVRAEADLRNEKLGYKIREAQLERIPYMFVVGENEQSAGTVSIRRRGEGDIGAFSVEDAVRMIQEEVGGKVY